MYYTKRSWSTAQKCGKNDSKFEAGIARDYGLLKMAGEIKDFEEQKNIRLIVNGYEVCTYRIDFVVYHNDGTTEYVESKGRISEAWKLKWKLFESLYSDLPDVKLTVIYQGKNWRPRLRKIK